MGSFISGTFFKSFTSKNFYIEAATTITFFLSRLLPLLLILTRIYCTLYRGGTTWTRDFKCREVKTGFCRKKSIQTGSSETLIGWKSGQTTYFPLWDKMEGAWLWTQCTFICSQYFSHPHLCDQLLWINDYSCTHVFLLWESPNTHPLKLISIFIIKILHNITTLPFIKNISDNFF